MPYININPGFKIRFNLKKKKTISRCTEYRVSQIGALGCSEKHIIVERCILCTEKFDFLGNGQIDGHLNFSPNGWTMSGIIDWGFENGERQNNEFLENKKNEIWLHDIRCFTCEKFDFRKKRHNFIFPKRPQRLSGWLHIANFNWAIVAMATYCNFEPGFLISFFFWFGFCLIWFFLSWVWSGFFQFGFMGLVFF